MAHILVYLHQTFNPNADGSLRPQLSREEFAGIIGTATESCIRLLSDMAKEGLIRLDGRKIFVENLSELKKIWNT